MLARDKHIFRLILKKLSSKYMLHQQVSTSLAYTNLKIGCTGFGKWNTLANTYPQAAGLKRY